MKGTTAMYPSSYSSAQISASHLQGVKAGAHVVSKLLGRPGRATLDQSKSAGAGHFRPARLFPTSWIRDTMTGYRPNVEAGRPCSRSAWSCALRSGEIRQVTARCRDWRLEGTGQHPVELGARGSNPVMLGQGSIVRGKVGMHFPTDAQRSTIERPHRELRWLRLAVGRTVREGSRLHCRANRRAPVLPLALS
jgi:hypothetical protein